MLDSTTGTLASPLQARKMYSGEEAIRGISGAARGAWSGLGRGAYGRSLQEAVGFEVGMFRAGDVERGYSHWRSEYVAKGAGARGSFAFLGLDRARRIKMKEAFRGAIKGKRGALRASGKLLGGTALKTLGPAVGAYFVYQGYKEEGLWGATKAGAENIAFAGVYSAVSYALPGLGTAAAVALPVAAVGLGAYALGEAAQEHVKGLRKVEMGAEVVDRFGTMSTLRQRSLMALQNSHINGRIALGNEALLIHASF